MILFGLALVAFSLWALVDALTSAEFRHGDRWIWVLVIALLFFTGIGALIYLAVGRESRGHRPVPRHPHPSLPSRPIPRGPDDDPDFLRRL